MSASGGVIPVDDGIKNAPAAASVGVAPETAAAALLRNRVTDVAAMGNICQSVAISPGLKAVSLVTPLLGMTGIWIAILDDTAATVRVMLHALRLRRFNHEREG